MGLSLGNLAVASARTLGGYGRGKLAGAQLGIQLEDRNRQMQSEALRLSLAQRADVRGERGEVRADQSLRDLQDERASNRSYRDALLRRTATPRQEQSDAYAAAKAVADYQAGTNGRAWKPETLAVYLYSRWPKLDQNRLLGIAQQALAKAGGLLHLNLDQAAENLPE